MYTIHQTITGDTLVASLKSANQARRSAHHVQDNSEENQSGSIDSRPVLAALEVPDPVFFCSIEPQSLAYQKPLEHALACLVREDPSLRVREDPETGQTILSGMGELHLDIIEDRIQKEYGVEAQLGPLQIAYKESISGVADNTVHLERTFGDTRHVVTATVTVRHSPRVERKPTLAVEPQSDSQIPNNGLKPYLFKAVQEGVTSAFSRGRKAINCCLAIFR